MPAPPPRARTRKRRADESPDAPHIKSESITPRKSAHPQVEVVIMSPPRQGKRTRRDKSPSVATGDSVGEECVSQATGEAHDNRLRRLRNDPHRPAMFAIGLIGTVVSVSLRAVISYHMYIAIVLVTRS
ncbi:hypothetical protein EDB85DRAFT_2164891 [Lactarius pseudohatsudake]|nr:hypothetical protein EDB85DRAFT_2164891 [Lactarius pseudohatsudake]